MLLSTYCLTRFKYVCIFPSSKIGTKIREVYFPTDSITIWDKCDILFTANPDLLESKPEGKISVKIKTEYNKDVQADYSFKDLSTFLANNENTEKLLNEFIRQRHAKK